jgi:uncharacterized membrane protein YoaK (UPF0700 family)
MNNSLQSGFYTRGAMLKWSLMAFIAGSINAGGFLACQRFVSHVTGFATLFGVGMAEDDSVGALSMLSVPAFFLLGAMISGFLTDVRLQRGHKPRFGLVMGMVASLLFCVTFLGYFEWFGPFGVDYKGSWDYLLLILLCGACGLQNAAVTSGSRSLMRATHLTGMTTDLGIGIVRAVFGRHDMKMRMLEFYRTFVRLCILIAFALGSLIGAIMFLKYGYLGFLLPATLATITGYLGQRIFIYHLDT